MNIGYLWATSDYEAGKIGPVPSSRRKTKPCAEEPSHFFLISLDPGATKAFNLRLAWLGFRSQRCSP
jgi:hypothetical protein